METKLLAAADRAAKLERCNRSAFVRDAVREKLQRLQIRRLEKQERLAYAAKPDRRDDVLVWESVAAWPDK